MWRRLLTNGEHGGHIAQFYDGPEFLEDVVELWLGAGLIKGGGAVLVCSKEKRDRVRARLDGAGLDPNRLHDQGRLVWVDADSFVMDLLESGSQNAAPFNNQVERILESVRDACGGNEVRVWDESGDLLRRRDAMECAKSLEMLWNDAIEHTGIFLLCSYGLSLLDPQAHRGAMVEIMENHSDVIPAQDYAQFNEAVDTALTELYGVDEACTLWTKFWSRPWHNVNAPAGLHILSFCSQRHPAHAKRVFECVRQDQNPPVSLFDHLSSPTEASRVDGWTRPQDGSIVLRTPAGTPHSVVIVDDEPDVRESIVSLFETQLPGVRVFSAGSGQEALRVVRENEIGLVITDYKMPGMDGLELLDQVHKMSAPTKRALITAFPRSVAESASDLDFFLLKPLDVDEVVSHAERTLNAV